MRCLVNMNDLKNTEFVIFDVETTGLSPVNGDRIVEIAALKIKNLSPVTKFHSLIDPEREISAGAFAINGITREMITGAPKAGEVLPHFLTYIETAVVVAYNAKFDEGFLSYELSLLNQKLAENIIIIDALKMARVLLPYLNRYSLWYVAKSLGIEDEQSHRAMADVQMTWQVFLKLLEIASRQKINDTQTFVKRFSYNRGFYQYGKRTLHLEKF